MWKYVTQNSHNDQLNWIKFVVGSLFMHMSPQLACHHKGFQLICWSVNCFMVRWQFGYEYYILAKQTFVWKVKSCSKSNTPHLHVLLYVVLVILVFSFNVTNVLSLPITIVYWLPSSIVRTKYSCCGSVWELYIYTEVTCLVLVVVAI